MQDKIFEVLVGDVQAIVRGHVSKRKVWKKAVFEEIKPGMIFRVCNDPEYEGKIYRCTSNIIDPGEGKQPLFHCDEVKEIYRPKPKFVL